MIIYFIFLAIGVGLASPYLLIRRLSKLIRFLPKPAPCMDTFKQVMGFVLLGTVVFLLTFIDRDYVVPTFALLSVLWAACWWINRTPLTADASRRVLAHGSGRAVCSHRGLLQFHIAFAKAFGFDLGAVFDRRLEQAHRGRQDGPCGFHGRLVPNCKLNTKVAIDTDAVRQAAEANGVVPLLADYSDESDEIKQMLEALGSRSIPLLAVFPAGQPTRPIVLRDIVTKSQVVEALQQAGPSKKNDGNSIAMNNSASK